MLKSLPRLFLVLTATLLPWGCLQAQDEEAVTRPVVAASVAAVEKIAPVASDGHAGLAFLRKPPGDGPFPAVMLVHGGAEGWAEDRIREYATDIHASRWLAEGFVVVAVTRRDLDMQMPAEQKPVLDLLAIYDWLGEQDYVDADSIVVRGTSVGGYLTLEVAAARTPAAIIVEEPFSFPFLEIALGQDDMTPDTTRLEKLQSPIFLIRGDQTPSLNDLNRRVLIPALGQADKQIDVMTFPGELHSFAFYDNAERTLRPAVSLHAFELMRHFAGLHIATQAQPLADSEVDWQTVP